MEKKEMNRVPIRMGTMPPSIQGVELELVSMKTVVNGSKVIKCQQFSL